MLNCNKNKGYSIIELLVVIVIVGIITAVALKSLTVVNDTVRTERTKKELDQLAHAVSGDPNLTSGGTRTDFGYVGDVGGMPANLDALVANPGGYVTWQGPYLRDDYLPSSGSSNTEFKVDEWGTAYSYSGSNTIASTGGGSTITRKLANSVNDLLYNSVAITVTDLNRHAPGAVYNDSIQIVLTHPNGTGGTTTKTRIPANDGYVKIDSVPVGQHTLKVIYLPSNDTLTRKVVVNPGGLVNADVSLFEALWQATGGGSNNFNMVIIRPNGPGNSAAHNNSGCPSNWQCVDEVSSDADATYIQSPGSGWSDDLYTADDPAVTGTINHIIIYIRIRNTAENDQRARTAIRIGGSTRYGTNFDLDGVSSYAVYSRSYTTNPVSGVAWTWTDINNLQIGIRSRRQARCTQVWAEVYYTP